MLPGINEQYTFNVLVVDCGICSVSRNHDKTNNFILVKGKFINGLWVELFQIDDGSGMKREATVDDLIKIIEELTRIH